MSHEFDLVIDTPEWALPLIEPARYKGAKGGRGSGKSHFFAELLVEMMVVNKDLACVCIREIQKSLKFSAKKLVEGKIRSLGVSHLFDITLTEIRRKGGDGICIFQGMQDHTADSIKSLEGFHIAWVEEAQSISARSLELLLPTIRADGSEIWLSWNPDQPYDPVDRLMCGDQKDPDAVCVHVNYQDNPFCPETLKKEAEKHRVRDPDTFGHVWLGEYKDVSDAQILNGKWIIREFEPFEGWQGPYHGLDFGFANDPTAATKSWIFDRCLWIEREAGKTKLELEDTAGYLEKRIPGITRHVVRADSARPESISYLKRSRAAQESLPLIEPVKKWPGSVEDGIAYLRSFEKIIVHTRCVETAEECRKWSYKVDKSTGDVLPEVVDAFNHYMDSIRYALQPMIGAGQYDLDAWG